MMDQIGLDLCFGLGEFLRGDLRVSMVPCCHWKRSSVKKAQLLEELAHEEANLLESKYKKADLEEVVNNQTHLSNTQQEKLG